MGERSCRSTGSIAPNRKKESNEMQVTQLFLNTYSNRTFLNLYMLVILPALEIFFNFYW